MHNNDEQSGSNPGTEVVVEDSPGRSVNDANAKHFVLRTGPWVPPNGIEPDVCACFAVLGDQDEKVRADAVEELVALIDHMRLNGRKVELPGIFEALASAMTYSGGPDADKDTLLNDAANQVVLRIF
jgi:hypothetical protein